jgi:uncharacterized membrane protein (UPF0127 family)
MVRVSLEVARTPEEQRQGLMHRRYLAPDRGMLFVYDEPRERCLWMKNTHVPLDMIFLDRNHVVVDVVENAAPRTTQRRCSAVPAQYVIEVVGGFVRKHRIRRGSRVDFERVP